MNEAEGYDLNEIKKVDQSFRRVVLGFWVPAIVWMLISGTLAYVLSVKLYKPEYLTHFFGLELSWLTYGRLFGVWQATMIFGWGCSMMLGAGIWLMGRIAGKNLSNPLTVGAGALLWHLGVVIGVYLVLSGGSRGNSLFGLPYEALLVSFAGTLFWIWGMIGLIIRSEKKFIAQEYALGGAICLVWVLSTTLLFASRPISGAMMGLLGQWTAHGIIYLFLIPMGIAIAYYLVPILLNKTLRFYGLARLGFWSWIFFASWSGTQGLTGAPLPVWLVGVGVTASILLILPIAIMALNLLGTLQDEKKALHENHILRFVVTGLAFLVVGGFTHVAIGISNWSSVLSLTHYPLGQLLMWVMGFVTFVALGIFYYGLPYLVKCSSPSPGLTKVHFWTVFYGTAAFAILILISGITQGRALQNPDLNFNQVIEGEGPYFRGRVVALALLFVGAVAFSLNLIKMVLGNLIYNLKGKFFRRVEMEELV